MNKITEQITTADPEIQVWTGAAAATIDDVYTQITQLGELTGRGDAAEDLIDDMKQRISDAVPADADLTTFSAYYELDNTYYSITSNTFVGALLSQFGFTSIADGVEEGNDYPQLSAEAIVAADPAVIFLADTKCCQQTAATVAERSGWSGISAVKSGNVVELDDDIASRWGPRIVDLIEEFAAARNALLESASE
jgi:iron complex transport system substrate-binding protein